MRNVCVGCIKVKHYGKGDGVWQERVNGWEVVGKNETEVCLGGKANRSGSEHGICLGVQT